MKGFAACASMSAPAPAAASLFPCLVLFHLHCLVLRHGLSSSLGFTMPRCKSLACTLPTPASHLRAFLHDHLQATLGIWRCASASICWLKRHNLLLLLLPTLFLLLTLLALSTLLSLLPQPGHRLLTSMTGITGHWLPACAGWHTPGWCLTAAFCFHPNVGFLGWCGI